MLSISEESSAARDSCADANELIHTYEVPLWYYLNHKNEAFVFHLNVIIRILI